MTARRSISTGDSLELRDNLEVKLSPARGMNKTLYIREEDAAIWDRARELTGEKLSNFLTQLLKAYVAEQEAKALGYERIVLSFVEDGLPVCKAFSGMWLIPPGERFIACYQQGEPYELYGSVAVTPKKNFVVFVFEGWVEAKGEFDGATFGVYDSLTKVGKPFSELVVEAHRRLGVSIQELDI